MPDVASIIYDLAGRSRLAFDADRIAETAATESVLVTGGGGSIGSAVVRRLLRHGARRVVALERSEHDLFSLGETDPRALQDERLVPVLGDARDRALLERVFDRYESGLVIHTASYKHAPLLEAFPIAAIQNNVGAAAAVARAANRCGVPTMISVSSDKAVTPVGVMGATKRAVEVLLGTLGAPPRSRFISARFGNVFGSRGSVVPMLVERIRDGQPLTLTHADSARYFLTEDEAVDMLLAAPSIGDDGDVLVADLGMPVRIVDVARAIADAFGRPLPEISLMGLREGEKLVEQLVGSTETAIDTAQPGVRRVRLFAAAPLRDGAATVAGVLEDALGVHDADATFAALLAIVPEYVPSDRVLGALRDASGAGARAS